MYVGVTRVCKWVHQCDWGYQRIWLGVWKHECDVVGGVCECVHMSVCQ